MPTVGLNGYRASRKSSDGMWLGTGLLNVRYTCGVLMTRVVASALIGTEPAAIQFVYFITERREATPAEVKALCGRKKAVTPRSRAVDD